MTATMFHDVVPRPVAAPLARSKRRRVSETTQPEKRAGESPGAFVAALEPASLPVDYGLQVRGNCMLPAIADCDALHFNTEATVKAGDVVVVYKRPELCSPGELPRQVKRLVTNIPPGMTFPYRDNPKSEVHPVLVLELTNPARRFYVRCSELLAVHKCVGKINAAQVAP